MAFFSFFFLSFAFFLSRFFHSLFFSLFLSLSSPFSFFIALSRFISLSLVFFSLFLAFSRFYPLSLAFSRLFSLLQSPWFNSQIFSKVLKKRQRYFKGLCINNLMISFVYFELPVKKNPKLKKKFNVIPIYPLHSHRAMINTALFLIHSRSLLAFIYGEQKFYFITHLQSS